MKNKLITVLVLSLCILPTISFADNASSTNPRATLNAARLNAKAEFESRKKEFEQRREDLKTEMEEKREAVREDFKAKREDAKNEFEAKKEDLKEKIEQRKETAISKIQERLVKFNQNIKERFEAAIERLDQLASRIESRITKLETEGKDVKSAKDMLAVAKIKIDTAKTSIAGIDLEANNIASSTATSTAEFKVQFEKLKGQVEQAKGDLKAAHAALIEVIENLKPGLMSSTTKTTSN